MSRINQSINPGFPTLQNLWKMLHERSPNSEIPIYKPLVTHWYRVITQCYLFIAIDEAYLAQWHWYMRRSERTGIYRGSSGCVFSRLRRDVSGLTMFLFISFYLSNFGSVLVSVFVFMALSTVFHSINSPFSYSVVSVFSLPCWFFQLYISLRKSPSALIRSLVVQSAQNAN